MKYYNHTIPYNPELIPSIRKPVFASYDNKKLKNWNCDDFADYIFDNQDAKGELQTEGTFFNDTILEYIKAMPQHYQRVYLYGVFELFKSRLRLFTKTKEGTTC